MPSRLSATLALSAALLVAGCAQRPAIPPPAAEVCPPAAPAVECPPWPDRGDTLRAFLRAWATAQAAHVECLAALRAWEAAWRQCPRR